MELPLTVAEDEIKRLVAGEDTRHVLDRCESCFSCNAVCPEGANPARLILDAWNRLYREKGLPARAKYFIPYNRPNFRTFVVERMSREDRELVRSWEDDSPCEEIFFPGCNWITAPFLARTRLLDGLAIRGSLEVCCGEMHFRSGLYDKLEEIAERLSRWLAKMGVKRMIIPCTAGRNLFLNVLPRFGFTYEIEVTHMIPWLIQRIDAGEIEIEKRLGMTVTIQESCHAKAFGDGFMDGPRELLARIGVRVVEQEKCRDKMVCCGIGGGFSHPSSYNPLRLTTATLRGLKFAKDTGADAIACYCAGCMQMLATGQISNPLNRMPIYHVIELLQMAVGEETVKRSEKMKRAALFLAGVARHQGPRLISGKRVRLDKIDPESP
jgi:Fe-S oxidoreductase